MRAKPHGKPAALKILEGNPGKRPIIPEIPPLRELRLEDAPDWLSPEAREVWSEQLSKVPLGILGLHHAEPFGVWCELTVQRRRAAHEIHSSETGRFFDLIPRYIGLTDAWRKLTSELALTPVSTPKAPPRSQSEPGNPFLALKRSAM